MILHSSQRDSGHPKHLITERQSNKQDYFFENFSYTQEIKP